MEKINQKITVSFEYDVFFTEDIFNFTNQILEDIIKKNKKTNHIPKVLFFIEKQITVLHPNICSDIKKYCEVRKNIFNLSASPIVLNGGETIKKQNIINDLTLILNDNHLCRHSYSIIIGGGAFLDGVGFVSSIVHRGIRQIRIPTTVLSQNDSGVGVKNGINIFGKKNFLGVFTPPYAVINDFNFLTSLSNREWVSGISEAFKVALIKDADFFYFLCENCNALVNRNKKVMQQLIKRCAELHLDHIRMSGDAFEFGSARPLDFGHWLAHKLESMSNNEIKHGEAVAIGIIIDSYYAVKSNLLDISTLELIIESFSQLGFKLWTSLLEKKGKDDNYIILEGIEEFREHLGGVLHITLPNGIGKRCEISNIDNNIIIEGVKFLKDNENIRKQSLML